MAPAKVTSTSLPLLLLILLVTVSNGSSFTDYCPQVTHSILNELIPQFHPTYDGHNDQTFQLIDFNITCLSLSNIRDQYRYTTISVTYITISSGHDNRTVTALIDIGCEGNRWDPTVLGPEVSFKYSQPIPNEALRMDCSMCVSDTHPSRGGNTTDPLTHCKVCHSNCSVPGTLSGCTGPLETDCCLVYNDNGTCNTKECHKGEIMNEIDYTCKNFSSSMIETFPTINTMLPSVHTSNSVLLITVLPTPTQSTVTHTVSTLPSDITFELIQLNVLTSFITTLITFTFSFTITTLIVTCCLCTRWKCIKRRQVEPPPQPEPIVCNDRSTSFITSTEYIEPSTSPSSVLNDRSMTDNISMNLNPAYYRIRYFGRPISAPAVRAVYDEIDGPLAAQAAQTRNRQVAVCINDRQPSVVTRNADNAYITILP